MSRKILVFSIVLCVALSIGATASPYGIQVVSYDKNTNYLYEMYQAALDGGPYALKMGAIYEQQRNLKIQKEGLSYEQTCFFDTYSSSADILRELNAHMNPPKYTEEDLLLLSKIIEAEAGSYWLSDEWKLAVGEVVLNRVDSPEFPNTIREVLEQPGQYYGRNSVYFNSIKPTEKSTYLAKHLLEGNRTFPKSVVFQSNYASLGSGYYVVYTDKYLGSSYFSYSYRPDLYR